MDIRYLGHACVLLTTASGRTVLMDPPDEKMGYSIPCKQVDFATMSHYHMDHCSQQFMDQQPQLPADGSALRDGDITIRYFDCWHDSCGGAQRGPNRIFRIEADGVSVVHLGDLGQMPTEEMIRFVQSADLLIAPVGGFFTLEPEDMSRAIDQFGCRTILPIHYRTAQSAIGQIHPLKDFLALRGSDRVAVLPNPMLICPQAADAPVTFLAPAQELSAE